METLLFTIQLFVLQISIPAQPLSESSSMEWMIYLWLFVFFVSVSILFRVIWLFYNRKTKQEDWYQVWLKENYPERNGDQ
jgi:heme/copper-type cytochrome/quinol oxidase subunit 4